MDQKKSARAVSLIAFIFMCVVSAVVFFTEEILDVFDILLIIAAPFALSALSYFVVLHHDPKASD